MASWGCDVWARALGLLTLAAAVGAAAVQEPPAESGMRDYLASRAADLEREFLPEVRTAEDFERRRPELRREYLDMMGLWPLPERTPLSPKVTGRLEFENFAVENLHFQSRPGLYVTANLYLPRPLSGRHPAILYLCGHYRRQKRDGAKSECQDRGIWFATHGYVCLVPDTLELGEIAAVHQGTCPGPVRPKRWWWQSANYTPAAVECWNGIRALDYLGERPEVDPARIGATGISGGGGATFWVAAADDRVKAAAPVSGMGDLGYYVGRSGLDFHCDCMFLYNRARWNWTTLAALVAPRPLLFVNSDRDTIFPMDANERVIGRLERLYALYGAGDRVDAVVSRGGHAYRTDIRRSVFEFFNRHLKGDARPVDDADSGLTPDGKNRIEYSKLRVFPQDRDLPADPLNTRIDRLFVPPAKLDPPPPDRFDEWRNDLLGRLRSSCFASWPAEAPPFEAKALGAEPADGRELTEPGIEVRWRWLPGRGTRRWLIVLGPDENLGERPGWAAAVLGEDSALLLASRAAGKGIDPGTAARAAALLGGTVDGGRVWDVLTVARRRPGGWRVAGRGPAGVLAAYAALYEPALEEVVAVRPPPSHLPASEGAEYGPPLLGVLRVLDIPDALGCLAPRRLRLIDAPDPAFGRTEALYRAAGSPDRLTRDGPK